MREEKLISDAVSSTCLQFVLDSPTWTKQGRNLCINVVLAYVDVPEHHSPTLRFPPSSDFNLVHLRSKLSRLIGGTLSERVSTQALMLIAFQRQVHEFVILKDMTVHVVPVLLLQPSRRRVITSLCKEVLGIGVQTEVLLQADSCCRFN